LLVLEVKVVSLDHPDKQETLVVSKEPHQHITQQLLLQMVVDLVVQPPDLQLLVVRVVQGDLGVVVLHMDPLPAALQLLLPRHLLQLLLVMLVVRVIKVLVAPVVQLEDIHIVQQEVVVLVEQELLDLEQPVHHIPVLLVVLDYNFHQHSKIQNPV